MNDQINKVIHAAVLGIMTLATVGATTSTLAAEKSEKCYGIVKAGMNDCNTSTTTCSGSATKDSQPDAFILLPKGMCNRIVGGSLTSSTKK